MTTTPTGTPVTLCLTCNHRHPITRRHCAACGRATVFLEPTSSLCQHCRHEVPETGGEAREYPTDRH